MTHILALDTSGTACSVALWSDNGLLLGLEEPAERQHTQCLLPMVKSLLAQADVQTRDAVKPFNGFHRAVTPKVFQ